MATKQQETSKSDKIKVKVIESFKANINNREFGASIGDVIEISLTELNTLKSKVVEI